MAKQNPSESGASPSGARIAGRVIGGFFKWFFAIIGTILLIGVLTASIVACYGAVYIKNVVLPESSVDLETYTLGENTTIYYLDSDTGEYVELRTLHAEDSSSVWVDYSDIPEDMLNAAVAIEDKRFYQHQGVDWWRTLGAVKGLLTGSDSYGGSTITQQLIKNITGNDEVTVKRKVTEIFQALEFEKNHSKSEILEYYLNIIYLGEGCSGVGSAAQTYFGKDVSELSLAECAALIGITNNPSKYDPLRTTIMSVKATDEDGNYIYDENGDYVYVDQTHEEANKERQETILQAMYDQGYITEEELYEAINEELQWVTSDDEEEEDEDTESDVFSWFEDALINQVLEDLIDAGYSEDAASLLLYSGGLSIYTTLDPEIQAIVDEVYTDESNFNYSSDNGQELESAITIIDNETGAVVAIAGGVGEKTGSLIYNRATQAKRQPGSAIKPLSVYAPAIDSGLCLPTSVYDDVPFTYDEETDTAWPTNSYKYYKGLTTVSDAVRTSSNAVAVQVLADLGLTESYEFLTEKLGFTTLVESRTSSSGTILTDIAYSPLALGGLTSGVTNLEMASAYATFARGGTYCRGYFYTSVINSDGTVLLSNDGSGSEAVSESTAFYMTQMLQTVVESGTGTAAALDNMPVAGKTGTTTDNYDRWFCGYTPYYTAAVWCGYDTNEEISTTTNVSTVIWQKIMSEIHEDLEETDFDTPGETVTVTYCLDSGLLPTSYCKSDQRGSRTATAVFLVGDEPTEECDVHIYYTYTRSIVLDIDRDYEAIGVLPKDYLYTLPWLVLQGYTGSGSSYSSYASNDDEDEEEEEEPEETEEDEDETAADTSAGNSSSSANGNTASTEEDTGTAGTGDTTGTGGTADTGGTAGTESTESAGTADTPSESTGGTSSEDTAGGQAAGTLTIN